MPPKKNTDWIRWISSAARKMILDDLQPGGFLFNNDELSAEDAFAHYTTLPEFSVVVFSQFKERLKDHRKQAKSNGKPGWIKWMKSPAREILIEDLQPGGPLYEKDDVSAEVAFGFYTTLPEFCGVGFPQFKDRLKDHRKQGNAKSRVSHEEMLAFAHDRALHPRQKTNERGELVFDLSAAKLLLREDVRNQLHTTMQPFELQQTRPEYMDFKRDIFRRRIYQEVRLQKYFFYLVEEQNKKRRSQAGCRSFDFTQSNCS
jgi:hypothetical protein